MSTINNSTNKNNNNDNNKSIKVFLGLSIYTHAYVYLNKIKWPQAKFILSPNPNNIDRGLSSMLYANYLRARSHRLSRIGGYIDIAISDDGPNF